jgi:iron complex outermembrane receptor protein
MVTPSAADLRSNPGPTMSRFAQLSALAVTGFAAGALAQSTATQQLDPVSITGRAEAPATVAGWGDLPLSQLPLQASVFGEAQRKDNGVRRLADLVGFDPAVSDAYNTEGYWDYLTVRGFVLDNRFNFMRDGLPINAETSIPLDNKEQVEILKGISGIQAGTSAPGGMVNYVVKRPTDAPIRSAALEWRQAGSVTGSVDLSQRFGEAQAFGVRLNLAAAHMDPLVRDAVGNRNLFALAGDWRLGSDTLIEAEIEQSHQSQPSVPGFSMLGNTVPAPADPRINLNDQPWSLPVVLDGTTASLRWRQRLAPDWQFIAHLAEQRLHSNDRIAFPFGCTAGNTYYPDRYCPNGNFDLYDYRSNDERRRSDVLDLSLQGRLLTGMLAHALTLGVQQSRVKNVFQPEAYNFAGTGNVDGDLITPPSPDANTPNTNRDERSTEIYLRDAVAIGQRTTAWLGVRYTHLHRDSVGTDGSQPTAYGQSLTTPWLAVSYAFVPEQLVYASWGQGIESQVVPNLPLYTNPGQALPALKSRQIELGLKGSIHPFEWNLAWFDIVQPQFGDLGSCSGAASCTEQLDGSERHRGIEAGGVWRAAGWTVRGGAQWLHARREGSEVADINGKRPTNVPAITLKLQAAYAFAALPGLSLHANLSHDGNRMVLPDNSASIPGFTRVDTALRYETTWAGTRWTWRAGIDNVFNERAWRESPYEYSHVYLFPLAPRSARVSVQADL